MRPWIALVSGALIGGCAAIPSVCLNGGRSCAAAHAPAGMRSVRKGPRIIRSHWVEKTNKGSGVPDIGIRAWTNSRGSRQVHLKKVNALGTCFSLMVNIFTSKATSF